MRAKVSEGACECVCVCVCVRYTSLANRKDLFVCARERMRARVSEGMCVCVCVCVCGIRRRHTGRIMCVCERESERARVSEGMCVCACVCDTSPANTKDLRVCARECQSESK